MERLILIKDEDDGYILAEYKEFYFNDDKKIVPIYHKIEYYHDLQTALKDEFGIDIRDGNETQK